MSDNFRHPSSPPPATNVPADQPGPAVAPTHIANGQMTTHDARHTETATNTASSNSHSPSPHQPVPPAHRHLLSAYRSPCSARYRQTCRGNRTCPVIEGPPQQVHMDRPARRTLTAGGHRGRAPGSAIVARQNLTGAARAAVIAGPRHGCLSGQTALHVPRTYLCTLGGTPTGGI